MVKVQFAILLAAMTMLGLCGGARAGEDVKPYTETIPGSEITFDMVPIPGGKFMMGSPDGEAGRGADEGPQHEVQIAPFWMGKCEVTWDEYDIFAFSRDLRMKKLKKVDRETQPENEKTADAVSRPTPPYVEMTFGYGHDGMPAICFTHHSALKYCEWLAAKTNKVYRLPTEAEWEYACRAGTTTIYSFGADAKDLDANAWFADNSNKKPQPVGKKKANPWGLHDMHGNVAEWCLDLYAKDAYTKLTEKLGPVLLPTADEYPYVCRGGSWQDKPEKLRSACRVGSTLAFSQRDPQLPQSIWWHTDAQFVGFRVVRPVEEQANLKGFKSPIKKVDLKMGPEN